MHKGRVSMWLMGSRLSSINYIRLIIVLSQTLYADSRGRGNKKVIKTWPGLVSIAFPGHEIL